MFKKRIYIKTTPVNIRLNLCHRFGIWGVFKSTRHSWFSNLMCLFFKESRFFFLYKKSSTLVKYHNNKKCCFFSLSCLGVNSGIAIFNIF